MGVRKDSPKINVSDFWRRALTNRRAIKIDRDRSGTEDGPAGVAVRKVDDAAQLARRHHEPARDYFYFVWFRPSFVSPY